MVDKFIAGCKTGLFTEFLPIPEDEKDNWYMWCVENWGSKWDVDNVPVEVENGIVTANFDTAWSPPIAFFEHLIELGFEVTAYYYEPGMAFCGVFNALGNDHYEISGLSSDEVMETIPEELDERFCISSQLRDSEEEENQEIELEDAFDETDEILSAKEMAKQEIRLAISSLEAALIALDNED